MDVEYVKLLTFDNPWTDDMFLDEYYLQSHTRVNGGDFKYI